MSTSDAPPAYTPFQHACVSLNMSDRLRLIRFPPAIIDIVRQAIIESWSRGIHKEKQEADFYEFKLHGNPWWGQGEEAVPSRTLVIYVLSALHNRGWFLLSSTDISKKALDKDCLIFQLGPPPKQTSFFSVAFDDYDKLRLINVPPELIPAVRQSLGQEIIQREEWRDGGHAYQFKLRGNPWISNGEDATNTRLRLLSLLDCFIQYGWVLHASIDISQGHEGRDVDSWFLRRDK
ncbi:unnamed protein product [Adineta ricciae]|uniref:Uncharacterized protein n=1 Tax=Adineta ricciae TaxID=249248 RepID=A0A813U658_ADIRI|nr:unnamed protein product [Adineta ricciae]CAF0997020.1 unnamed protein product [Adineta ricciae]